MGSTVHLRPRLGWQRGVLTLPVEVLVVHSNDAAAHPARLRASTHVDRLLCIFAPYSRYGSVRGLTQVRSRSRLDPRPRPDARSSVSETTTRSRDRPPGDGVPASLPDSLLACGTSGCRPRRRGIGVPGRRTSEPILQRKRTHPPVRMTASRGDVHRPTEVMDLVAGGEPGVRRTSSCSMNSGER